MAAATKVAAFGALLRVFYVAFGGLGWDWRPVVWAVAILTMVGRLAVRGHPDRRQADARLLLGRARRLHPRRGHRAEPAGLSGLAVLPARLRLDDGRRVRHPDPGARPRRRGHAPVPVGGSRPALPAHRRRLRAVPARARRHPAHQRVHRQVRRLLGRVSAAGPPRWSSSARCSSAMAAFFYVRVIVHDVLPRAGRSDGPVVVAPGSPPPPRSPSRSRSPWCWACSRSRSSTWPTRAVPFVR